MFKSIGEISKKILEIEKQENLFELSIEDVYVWELIRVKIYTIIVNQVFESEKTSEKKKKTVLILFKKINSKTKQLFYLFKKYPYFSSNNVDCVIFESSRKILLEKEYIDPHTNFLIRELKNNNTKIQTYQSSYNYDKLQEFNSSKSVELIYFLGEIYYRFFRFFIKDIELDKLNKISKIFFETFNVDISFYEMVKKEIFIFKYHKKKFSKILKNHNPEKIFLVNSCDKTGLISAAKTANIEVIDIQHGLISSNILVYHFPDEVKNKLKYFPDYFYIWDDVWKFNCSIPLSEDKIINYGNKYLKYRKSSFSKIKKINNTILIISQPGLTQQIAQETLLNMDNFSDYKIVYKLHPSEYAYCNEFEEILKLKSIEKVSFANQHDDLYLLLSTNIYVIGVYSTVLIEAIEFDCKILIYELPGMEMMIPFINYNKMQIFNKILIK